MDGFSWSLCLAAAGVALIHGVLGPDHYLPFIMLARARGWNAGRTAWITAVCGLGHVVFSIAAGGLGLALGFAVARMERAETLRGGLGAWALVAFGLAYGLWGLRRSLRRAGGLQPHEHQGHLHLHAHGDRPHRHTSPDAAGSTWTFWTLFAVFVLGPCEPLIPLFLLPASRGRLGTAAIAALIFAVVTIGTMVSMTLLGCAGYRRLRLGALERWTHAMAGGVITASGLAVLFLGL